MQLQKYENNNRAVLMLNLSNNKDHQHRMLLYTEWLDSNGGTWYEPDLNTYRDYLLYEYTGRDDQSLSPASVKAHLSTIRGHYQNLMKNNRIRDLLYASRPSDESPAEKKAFVDEILQRIDNAIAARNTAVKVVKRQDRPDEEHLRLTSDEAATLMAAPGTTTILGLRDTALITLMLCTGVREAELCALDVPDLRRKLGGQPALHVRRGKGAKERLIPYGSLIGALEVVDQWLQHAGINAGAVFRGFYKDREHVRDQRISSRAINMILDRYPIMVAGEKKIVNPHDLRRTYARRLYEAGMDLLAIRDNLGHSDSRTTLKYIGAMDVEQRKPPAIFQLPLPQLKKDFEG